MVQQRNYQVSKEEVDRCSLHANIDNLQYSDIYFNTYWQFKMFKRHKDNRHGTWYKCKFQNSFFSFSVTYVVGSHWNCLIEAIPMCSYNICLFNK